MKNRSVAATFAGVTCSLLLLSALLWLLGAGLAFTAPQTERTVLLKQMESPRADIAVWQAVIIGTQTITEGALFTDGLTVFGSLTATEDLSVTGGLTTVGQVAVAGNLTVSGDMRTSGRVSTNGSISVSGEMSTSGEVEARGDVDVGQLDTTGLVSVLGDLSATGGMTTSGQLFLRNRLSVTGGTSVRGALQVNKRALLIEPPTQINVSKENVLGDTQITGTWAYSNGLTINGDLAIDGNALVSGPLIVSGALVVTGSLEVLQKQIFLPVFVQVLAVPLGNQNFEAGVRDWTQFSSTGQPLILPATQLPAPPNSGFWAARLGSLNNEISLLSQPVSINAGSPCLTYQVWIQSGDSCEADFGGVGVNGRWHRAETLCAGTATSRWVPRHVDMSRRIATPISPTIVLNFAEINDYSAPSTMLVDDVLFQSMEFCETGGDGDSDDSAGEDPVAGAALHGDATSRLIGQPILAGAKTIGPKGSESRSNHRRTIETKE